MKKIGIIFFLSTLLFFLFQNQADKSQKNDFTIQVYGSAQSVSGSLSHIKYYENEFLVDCGAYYPEGNKKTYASRIEEARKKNEQLPVNAKKIDAVFITHAHIDHIGRLPLLYKKGFRGKIYCTPGTDKLMSEMLLSSIRFSDEKRHWVISKYKLKTLKPKYRKRKCTKEKQLEKPTVVAHWNNCKWQNKINKKLSENISRSELEKKLNIHISPCKVCAQKELKEITKLIEIVAPRKKIKVTDGFYITFLPTEHIPGSSSVFIEAEYENKTKRVLFSGDIGNRLALLQPQPKPFPLSDYIFLESTYGDNKRKITRESAIQQFINNLSTDIQENKMIWIPAFALDRTQKVFFLIEKAKLEGKIPSDIPVFVTSPTANRITKIYHNEWQTKRYGWFNEEVYQSLRFFPNIKNISILKNNITRPFIIISTSAMMDTAASEDMLYDFLCDPNVSIYIVGYQDPYTPGGMLKHSPEKIIWKQIQLDIKAKIRNYSFFSAHADAADILYFLQNQQKDNVHIFLVHGSPQNLKNLKKFLQKKGFRHVHIAQKKKIISLKNP